MNQVILMGRLTRDPETRNTDKTTIAHYTLAVDRTIKRDGEPTADFFDCTAFGRAAEFAEKHLKKGTKIAIVGRIQTRSYERDGVKHKTVDVIVDNHEFAESRAASEATPPKTPNESLFMSIPDDIDAELPFA